MIILLTSHAMAPRIAPAPALIFATRKIRRQFHALNKPWRGTRPRPLAIIVRLEGSHLNKKQEEAKHWLGWAAGLQKLLGT